MPAANGDEPWENSEEWIRAAVPRAPAAALTEEEVNRLGTWDGLNREAFLLCRALFEPASRGRATPDVCRSLVLNSQRRYETTVCNSRGWTGLRPPKRSKSATLNVRM